MNAVTLATTAIGIRYLDGDRLRRGIRAGIEQLAADCQHLNDINVFPIPDGDTGTNLVMTMNSVLTAMAADRGDHAGRTLTIVADAALDGARGNSGAILAQFFQGICDTVGELWTVNMDQFIDAVRNGAAYARQAISDPQEGTLLTVLGDFSSALTEHHGPRDFVPLLITGLARARVSLAHTREQLDALRKAGVVDAGAQGFVDLLQGVVEFIRSGSMSDTLSARSAGEARPARKRVDTAVESDLVHRFCTECMITAEHINHRKLHEDLASLGSSIVVAGTRRKVRIHIHADEPANVFDVAATYGELTRQKADDMYRQQSRSRPPVAVVTDTACDLPDTELERLDIHLVPLRIHFGERTYLDKISISADDFYDELVRNPQHPTTSQPAPGDFRRQYQLLASHHTEVVSIHVTSKVSGTWQTAAAAAARIDRNHVAVIDSRNASLGQALIVMHAAESARDGLSMAEITDTVEQIIPKTRTWAMVGNLEFGVRGGRIPRSIKRLADWLHVTPIIGNTPDGRVTAVGALFGRKNPIDRFARYVLRRVDPSQTQRIGIGHAQCEDDARKLMTRLRQRLPNIETMFCTELGTALGTHAGPGTVVVAVQQS